MHGHGGAFARAWLLAAIPLAIAPPPGLGGGPDDGASWGFQLHPASQKQAQQDAFAYERGFASWAEYCDSSGAACPGNGRTLRKSPVLSAPLPPHLFRATY